MSERKLTTATSVNPIWAPSERRANDSNMAVYLRSISEKTGQGIESYSDLYNWSLNNVEDFWESIWDLADIRHSQKYDSILKGKDIWDAIWFDEVLLNFAENLLRYDNDHPAIIATGESLARKVISYKELRILVAACAKGLKKLGVKKDDRVAAFIPNIPEAIIAMLATTSIGAIWSSCSPDFGFQSVMDRFG
ncbi:MAG: AMP-binding protein, partial [Candidatus Zixiibacteriota bacterium]